MSNNLRRRLEAVEQAIAGKNAPKLILVWTPSLARRVAKVPMP
jgi:hypothetical protein